MITEDRLEERCIEWFRQIGWEHAYGPDIAPDSDRPERKSYHDVLLVDRLRRAVARLNPELPPSAVEEATHALSTLNNPVLVRNNQAFHRLLLNGIPVEYIPDGQEKRKPGTAALIDFEQPERNEFLVVNQFTLQGTKHLRRPDMVLFVNGIPLAVIELKNPKDETADVWAAFTQLQTYRDEIPALFTFNEVLVVSDGITSRVGALFSPKERYMPWRTIRDENDQPELEFELETTVRGLFDRPLFTDYLRYFILFENDGETLTKKIAGYHQFHGVREAVRVTLIASAGAGSDRAAEARATYGNEVVPGSRKAGVFWHTQGAGKSISMCCYAAKLAARPEMRNPTIVVVTDRNDLDGQLFEQFGRAQDLLRQIPEQAENREELRTKLAMRQSGGIIFTTIQKFSLLKGEKEHPILCDRENVVIISDEAHRTQYGLEARLDQSTGIYRYGYAKHMRDAFPGASFIGFTGTPIAREDRNTRSIFGDYVSIYDIEDAVADGATVPIYYESRLAKLDINRAEIDRLNDEVEEVMEGEENIAIREQTKSNWAQLAKLVGARERIREVAEDIVRHFTVRSEAIEGKGMIVCMSREICVALFDEIIALRPEWSGTRLNGKAYNPEDGAIRIVMTGNAADKEHLQNHIYSGRQKKRLEKRFKDPDDPLKLVIVRDMWLTGFDAPPCHTMYIDKPMRGHSLMQAIARVNRVFKDKPGGLVVDYLGIAGELQGALQDYTDSKGKGAPTHDSTEALDILLEKMDVLRGIMHGFDYSDFATDALSLLVPAANYIVGRNREDRAKENETKRRTRKERFLDVMAAITRAWGLCSTLDEAISLREEIAFFGAVRGVIVKYTTVDKRLQEEERNSILKRILDNAVVSQGMVDIFSLAGIEKPEISILSDDFLEDLRHTNVPNLAMELLEKLLRDTIRGRAGTNVVQELKYSERLEETLRRYHNRAIETAQVIEELITMARQFREDLKREESLGLTPEEIAFYDALIRNESAVRELGDETLKSLAVELTRQLRKSTTIDWQVRESVRARLRNLVRRLLRRYKYPPDGQEEAIELTLQQAEKLSDMWSAAEVV